MTVGMEVHELDQERGCWMHPVHQSTEEQLHEVRASLAGVASAVRLLVAHDSGLSWPRQRRLEILLESEVTRLERLLVNAPPRSRVRVVADVLRPVVHARQLTGQTVHWRPSRSRALCVEDFLVEAVNILLVNADKHAGGSPVGIEMSEVFDTVEVRVSDRGPGVPPTLHRRVFETGFRGDDAGDQGIGLALARRLMVAQGGDLFLLEDDGPGATFILRLPAAADLPA